MTWSSGGLQLRPGEPPYSVGTSNNRFQSQDLNKIIMAMRGNKTINGLDLAVGSQTDLTATGTHLTVAAGTVLVAGQVKSVSATNIDLSGAFNAMTSGQARYVVIYVDSTGAVQTLNGSITTDGNHIDAEFPENAVSVGKVYLARDDTTFDSYQIFDERQFAPLGSYVTGTAFFDGSRVYLGYGNNDTLLTWKPTAATGGGWFEAGIISSNLLKIRHTTSQNGISLNIDGDFTVDGNTLFTLPQKAFHNSSQNTRSYYNIANYYETATVTGQIKITMPSNVTDVNKDTMMFTLEIEGYNHFNEVDRTAWKIVISGYTYTTTNPFSRYSAWVVYGTPPFTSVKFGNDGFNDFILLGEVTDTWLYPRIVLTAAHLHYGSYDNMENGWAISRVTTEPTTIYKTFSKIYSRINEVRLGYYNNISGNLVLESDGSTEAGNIEFKGVSGSGNISATSWVIDRYTDHLRFYYGSQTVFRFYSDKKLELGNASNYIGSLNYFKTSEYVPSTGGIYNITDGSFHYKRIDANEGTAGSEKAHYHTVYVNVFNATSVNQDFFWRLRRSGATPNIIRKMGFALSNFNDKTVYMYVDDTDASKLRFGYKSNMSAAGDIAEKIIFDLNSGGIETTSFSAAQNSQTIDPVNWSSSDVEQMWDQSTASWVNNSTAGTKHSFNNPLWDHLGTENVYQIIARQLAKIKIEVSEVNFTMAQLGSSNQTATFKWYYSVNGGATWVEGGNYSTTIINASNQNTSFTNKTVDVYGKDVTGDILVKLTLVSTTTDGGNTVDINSFSADYKIALGAV